MSVEEKKLEIIEWILKLNNTSAINEIMKMKNICSQPSQHGKRKFGNGKHIFIHVNDDFDAPLPDFQECINLIKKDFIRLYPCPSVVKTIILLRRQPR